jgi:glycosyltransferase involved in cell wall biosynthesis
MNIDISIIICCYNSSNRIKPTLEHIARQELVGSSCELVLVDNNCSDNTVDVAQAIWKECGSPFMLTIVEEKEPGLSNARKAGVMAAQGEIIVFCDDDNWLEKKYLLIANDILNYNPRIGILGGQSIAVSEIDPPEWFEEKKAGYAVGRQSEQSGDITNRGYIWGAGAVLRTEILIDIYNSNINSLLSGRKGKKLLAGDDSEICKWYILLGFQLWYDDRLKFKHFIPNERLTEDYVKKLREGFANSADILKAYDRFIIFKKELYAKGRIIFFLKIITKFFLVVMGFSKFKPHHFWLKQDLQLFVNSRVVFDQHLAQVQVMISSPLKKLNIKYA